MTELTWKYRSEINQFSSKDINRLKEACRLPRDFFTQDGLALARNLLGKILVHKTSHGIIRGIITETEAYMGFDDKGSHTYQGRRTTRTEPMYHIGGTSYVYFTYGMYYCMNITAREVDVAQAALLRSVLPLDDQSYHLMMELRMKQALARSKKKEIKNSAGDKIELENKLSKHLSDGPAKLCIAMDITKEQNDIDLVTNEYFYITDGLITDQKDIRLGKRIGIDYAEEAADYLWRFYLSKG